MKKVTEEDRQKELDRWYEFYNASEAGDFKLVEGLLK